MRRRPREHQIGEVATHAARRLLRRDRFQELIAQTRRRLEEELARLNADHDAARLERDAAEIRYQHRTAIVDSRREEIRRRLAAL